MTELIAQTVYFAKPGPENTERTLAVARERGQALGIDTVLVATTGGATAVRAAEVFTGFTVVAVTHSTGFAATHKQELTPENAAALTEAGVHILTTTHAFGGVGRAVRKKLGTYEIEEIIAFTLRIFGQGMKVVAEIALMAADAGLVPENKPVLAIAGTGRGADTAVVLYPTHAQTFFDLEFAEIICMPAPRHPALA
ncbi:MAG: pyruvate kinase alpha/beta domain-containing protein [Anaerolineae bacterium]